MSRGGKHDLVKYRIAKAKETYNEVSILVENRFWNTTVNRLYYACYYAVTALLAAHDVETQTHAGVRQQFGLHFVKTGLISTQTGRFYTRVFDLRQIGDYDDFIDFDEEKVKDLLAPAKLLIEEIEGLLKS